MHTAWVQDGWLVLRKPGLEAYAVEVSSASTAERMQVRAGALTQGKARAASHEIKAEQSWCNDFTRLRGNLAMHDSEVLVERQTAAGVVPLKEVETIHRYDRRVDSVKKWG